MHAMLYIGQMILLFYGENGSEISLLSVSGHVALFFCSIIIQTHLHQNSEDSHPQDRHFCVSYSGPSSKATYHRPDIAALYSCEGTFRLWIELPSSTLRYSVVITAF